MENKWRFDGEVRNYTIVGERSEHGRSRVLIVCPFCGREVWGYKWSMAGCGKKCPRCGAIHTWFYGTIKKRKSNKKEGEIG